MDIEPIHRTPEQLRFDMKFPVMVPRVRSNYIVNCPICLRQYTHRNKWNHEQTKIHKIYAKLNDKLRDLLMIEE